MGCTTAPVAGSGPWPTWSALVEKPPGAARSATRPGDELEEIGTREHADRRLAVEDDERGVPAEQGLEGLLDGAIAGHGSEGRVHGRCHRLRDDARVRVDEGAQAALLQAADEAAVPRRRSLPDGELGDGVALHQLDGLADRARGLHG